MIASVASFAPVAPAQPSLLGTKNWILALGLPPLPVAPAQDPHRYPLTDKKGVIQFEKDGVTPKPRFTGKNPSYLDESGVPHLVTHSKYQKRQPNAEELALWFATPLNGIGALGSDNLVFVDLDRKKFELDGLTPEAIQEACDAAAQNIIEAVVAKTSSLPSYERTQSFGWRIVVGLRKPPTFTNFTLTPGGVHIGEILGKGRFAVLAPTLGSSGNAYECHYRCAPDDVPVVDSLEEIGLYATKSKPEPKRSKAKTTTGEDTTVVACIADAASTPMVKEYPDLNGIVFELAELGTPLSKEVLHGSDEKGDRSASLTLAIKEWYGWTNWCSFNGISYRGDVETLALEAGAKLGIDADRVQRILQTIDAGSCTTATEYKDGTDNGCWKKVLSLAAKAKVVARISDSGVNGGGNDNANGKGNPFGGSGGKGKPTRREVLGYCKQMYAELFEDNHYIYVFEQFHVWTGTHYEPVNSAVVTKIIHDFCDTYFIEKENKDTGETYLVYPYADPSYVNKGLAWLKQKVGVDPALINPPGLNCVDGVLQLSYDPDGGKWIRNFVEHDPKFYYLYAPQVTYHIPAVLRPDACNRLLDCLDPIQRDIFLKTIGAALDLPTVRRYRGRGIRALLLQGLGNNGKDTLREVTSMLFGHRGLVSASLSDFQQYDQGRKFPLQKLDGAIVNWPSENADSMMIDRLQSLKMAITGDPLSGEKKGKDEYLFRPRCIHLFNVNSPPRLQGSMEAILSRFAIIKLTKTYKANPGEGELQADPRFLYDPDYVRREVLPWYLHYVLDALDALMREGIDYDATEDAWEELRTETDHVYAFCREVGIGYKNNAQLGAEEVYAKLREWYIQTGALEVEELDDGRKRDRWSPNPSWGDNLVKGRNQIFPRLLKIFPQAKRERDSQGRSILVGIGWIPPSPIDAKGADFDGATVEVSAQNVGDSVSIRYVSEDGLKMSEDGLKMVKARNSNVSEDAEDVLGVNRDKNNPLVVSAALIQKAYGVAEAMAACTTKAEAKAVLVKFGVKAEEKTLVWYFLTESGQALVTTLFNAASTEVDEIKEDETLNHLQDVQNASTVGVSTASEDVQTSSDHLQNGNVEIQKLTSNVSASEAPTPNASDAKTQPAPRKMNLRNKRVRIYANDRYEETTGVVLMGDTYPGPVTVKILGGEYKGQEWIVEAGDYELLEGSRRE